ncbi:hypothetical protein SeMB42_g02056 [Synchytrium endobioticum]|uniref:Uncharacterized protein n=1 Tax=Synchytrium endobioticum TaxID=286115 RepID=A0A507DAV9_9FUNG|nr:hypothetical protein SeLEV6574_g01994 [Synchytrium endobioticum]TPX50945.1 hypothetical protein SeMB42_g02056 [Synchytrium endobioticum]
MKVVRPGLGRASVERLARRIENPRNSGLRAFRRLNPPTCPSGWLHYFPSQRLGSTTCCGCSLLLAGWKSNITSSTGMAVNNHNTLD